jgi:hypothetical protein
MEVVYGLPAVSAGVGHDPKAVRGQSLLPRHRHRRLQAFGDKRPILGPSGFQVRDVAAGDDQNVGGGDGADVAERDDVGVLKNLVGRQVPLGNLAEQAAHTASPGMSFAAGPGNSYHQGR